MMLEMMQYSAAALWIIAALLWVRNQIRIKKAINLVIDLINAMVRAFNDAFEPMRALTGFPPVIQEMSYVELPRLAITELNREVTRLKESENEQSIAREILSAKIAVNERTASPLTADAGGSVRPES